MTGSWCDVTNHCSLFFIPRTGSRVLCFRHGQQLVHGLKSSLCSTWTEVTPIRDRYGNSQTFGETLPCLSQTGEGFLRTFENLHPKRIENGQRGSRGVRGSATIPFCALGDAWKGQRGSHGSRGSSAIPFGGPTGESVEKFQHRV